MVKNAGSFWNSVSVKPERLPSPIHNTINETPGSLKQYKSMHSSNERQVAIRAEKKGEIIFLSWKSFCN
ncbi:hypothetical protein ABEB36_003030 [Hypothenemus hampei]|uniref:Uncharacterized protein n=1 Tax=Hypothenemus hampei TaxID=57062 RepID=A0ABD1F7S7_HYPHA